MRSALLVLFLIVVGSRCCAQQGEPYDGSYRFKTGSQQTVFSDTAFVRAAPDGAVQDTLYAFAAVRIKRRRPQTLAVGRKAAPWYEVAYEVKGVSHIGVIWGGALALAKARRDGVDFAFSVLSYPQLPEAGAEPEPFSTGYTTCAIKARTQEGRVQQCWYNISPESVFFLDAGRDADGKPVYERFGKAGPLPAGARFLVRFYMSGEACGIPSYQISAAWDGTRLVRMPLLESNADAGVWQYEEAYVYPAAQGGMPGHLSIRGVSEEYEDSEAMRPKPPKRTVSMRRYRWEDAAHRFRAVK